MSEQKLAEEWLNSGSEYVGLIKQIDVQRESTSWVGEIEVLALSELSSQY